MLTYDIPAHRQTGSRNLMGPKTLPTIWGTYMKLVTKYQISAINSCWEKWAYTKCMFNVYNIQQSGQTGSRNLTDPKTLEHERISIYTLKNKVEVKEQLFYCCPTFHSHRVNIFWIGLSSSRQNKAFLHNLLSIIFISSYLHTCSTIFLN
jgi:hypothetical protein